MKKTSLRKALLLSSIISTSAVASEIDVSLGHVEDSSGALTSDYNFGSASANLDFTNSPPYINTTGMDTFDLTGVPKTTLFGKFIDSANGSITFKQDLPYFVISNNQTNIDLANINFESNNGSGTSLFVIDNPGSETIINGNWNTTSGSGWHDWSLQFISPVTITNSSIGNMISGSTPTNSTGSFFWGFIGSESQAGKLKYATETGHNIGQINFMRPDSEFILSNENCSGDSTYGITHSLGGLLVDSIVKSHAPSLSDKDESGIVRISATNHDMYVDSMSSGNLGVNNDSRLNKLDIQGDSRLFMYIPTYTKNLNLNSSGDIHFGNNGIHLGQNGTINLEQDTNIAFTFGGSLFADSPTVNLGNNRLKINEGSVFFGGNNVVFNVEFTDEDTRIGKVIVNNGAIFDMSSASNVQINFTADTADETLIANNGLEYTFKLFEDLTQADAALDNIFDNAGNINLIASESNPLIEWSYDPNTHTLTSKTKLTSLVETIESGEVEVTEETKQIVEAVTKDATSDDPNPRAVAFLQAIGQGAETPAEILENLNSSDLSSPIAEAGTFEAEEAIVDRIADVLQSNFDLTASTSPVIEFTSSPTSDISPTIASPNIDTSSSAPSVNVGSSVSSPPAAASSAPSSSPAGSSSNIGGSSTSSTNAAPTSNSSSGNINSNTSSESSSTSTAGSTSSTSNSQQGGDSNASSDSGSVTSSQSNVNSGNKNENNQSERIDENKEAEGNILGVGVGAGDDLSSKYGIWFSPFYQKGIQKKYGKSAGYKVENFGGAIGVDCKANESLTVGFAWSNIKSMLRQTGAKHGSKSMTRSNILSLYGAYELSNNYFVSSIASYGFSTVKNGDRRPATQNRYQFAKSKYKTKMYSIQANLGKHIGFKGQYSFTPTLGIKYSEFHNNSYKENGTLLQNHSLSKKRYSQLDGILSGKLSYKTSYKDYAVTPHISGTVYYSLKENPATTYITGDKFSQPIQLKGDKRAQKAWYTISAGIDSSKDNIEYGISYERQIDKKYVGHQAKMKIKVSL